MDALLWAGGFWEGCMEWTLTIWEGNKGGHKGINSNSSSYLLFFVFIFNVYFWAWERKRESEREFHAGSALSAQSPMWGLNSWNCEIMTWAETKNWTRNWLTPPPPGAPKITLRAVFLYGSAFWVGRGNRGKLLQKSKKESLLCVFQIWNYWCRIFLELLENNCL